MGGYKISLNQLAEFRFATEKGKKRLIQQQLNPDQFKIPWYQLPKSRIKKSLALKGDLSPIVSGMAVLRGRKAVSKRQEIDKQVSLEALERFLGIEIPSLFKELDFVIIRPIVKSTIISGVEIIAALDLVVRGRIDDKTILGGVKIHISKSKPFNYQKALIVSNMIYAYLKNEIADDQTLVIPELCFCLDVFSGRIVTAQSNVEDSSAEVISLLEEMKGLWGAA